MIEYEGQDGGRYTYIEDILNLQELALAFSSIFNECDNFIISGCEVSGTNISAGYVYINGKIRHFNGASNIKFPLYIYENNRIINVTYADTNSKTGRKIYSCASGTSIPSNVDEITGAVPQAITITATSAPRLNDAFFGKYALTLNSSRVQTVAGKVIHNGAVTFTEGLTSSKVCSISNTLGDFQIVYDESGNLEIQSTATGKTPNKFVINSNGAFRFYNGTTLCAEITSDSINLNNHSLIGFKIQGGNIAITSSEINNVGVGTNAGSIDINKSGYNGKTAYFRDFKVYDGKGSILFNINGSEAQGTFNGKFRLIAGDEAGLILKSSAYNKSNTSLKKMIYWQDSAEVNIAAVGYDLETDNVFRINNTIGDIEICPSESLNVVGNIKENGVLLSKKYLSADQATIELNKKADTTYVYSRKESDEKYLNISKGFAPMVDYLTNAKDPDAKQTLRNQIGAISKTDTDKLYIAKAKLFSDIAINDATKKEICNNIGAAYAPETQGKLKDSGWKQLQSPGLYIRQIGNIVVIQGTINISDGLIANIPNEIDPPTYSCGVVANTDMDNDHEKDRGVFIEIAAGSRNLKCTRNTYGGNNLPFALTYMV